MTCSNLTRRGFLSTSAAASTLPLIAGAAAAGLPELRAAPGQAQLAPEGYGPTDVWAYGGSVPGLVIRVKQGARVERRLINGLPDPTTVHWHGIRIDNAMDGVPELTQAAVAPGAGHDYAFTVPDAGTFWYHPHNRTWEQLARGLYGALIVEEETPPEVDRDEVLLIDDWRLGEDGQLHPSFGNMHDWAHAGRLGNWVTVNGNGHFKMPVRENERLRLRLVNVANARTFPLALRGFRAWLVALDGMPLIAPQPVDRLTLASAQRADLIVDVTAAEGETALIMEPAQDGSAFGVADLPVSGRTRSVPLGPPSALPPNPVPGLGDLDSARQFDLRMEGGAMGRMQMRPGGDNGEAPGLWALAGSMGMPESPFLTADRGETIRIRLINDTAWDHAMHLHGHHFRPIGPGGPGPLRDTFLVQRGETTEIALVTDNPGDWLLHCHMVEHSASGMMTWFHVG